MSRRIDRFPGHRQNQYLFGLGPSTSRPNNHHSTDAERQNGVERLTTTSELGRLVESAYRAIATGAKRVTEADLPHPDFVRQCISDVVRVLQRHYPNRASLPQLIDSYRYL